MRTDLPNYFILIPFFSISALYGSIFTDSSEAAFSNYRMWESLGFIIAFAYSNFLCTLIKTIVLTSVLVIGMTGFFATEIYVRNKRSGSVDITDPKQI